jgi:hypothetical protein
VTPLEQWLVNELEKVAAMIVDGAEQTPHAPRNDQQARIECVFAGLLSFVAGTALNDVEPAQVQARAEQVLRVAKQEIDLAVERKFRRLDKRTPLRRRGKA